MFPALRIMSSRYPEKKRTVEEVRHISTAFLKEHDCFCELKSGSLEWTNRQGQNMGSIGFTVRVHQSEGEIRFQYSRTHAQPGQRDNLEYPVRLTATPCNYGGQRWWFVCPLVRDGVPCNGRVGKLYHGDKYFGCRRCYNLTYKSCQEHDARIDRLRKNPLLLRQWLDTEHPPLVAFRAAMKLHTEWS